MTPLRAQALQLQLARTDQRPVPASMLGGMSGGISLPLFSRGPSREQRRRDSIIFAENLQLLQRVQLRLRRRNDSIRYADSLLRLRMRGLPDSSN
ncbi:MAG TPA: hypothetical protein VJ867_10700 [Gemmatimonadaceae bacterium]|nr:hypothetical protein [Gemmatimonadaceae bacterium]